jgi:5'-nucleotidase
MTPSRIRAILFDWGETLVHFPGVTHVRHVECLGDLHREMSRTGEAGAVPWPEFRAAYLAVAAGQLRHSRATLREHRLEDRFAETLRRTGLAGRADPAGLVERMARRLLACSRPVDGAARVLAVLSARYRLGLVSNYPHPPTVLESLARFRLRRHLDGCVVVSGALGWIKPDPRPFRRALSLLGATPQETLFVGDDLENDMRGGRSAGLATAWLASDAVAAGRWQDLPAVGLRLARLADLPAALPWVRTR